MAPSTEFAQHGFGIRAEDRGGRRRAARSRLGQGSAGGEDLADARLVDEADQGVSPGGRVGGELGERAVAVPQHGGAAERGGDLVRAALREPGGDQGGDHLAVRVPVAVAGEVRAERLLHRGEGSGPPGDAGEIGVVPRGEGHDHDGVA